MNKSTPQSTADILFPKRGGKFSFGRMVFSDDSKLKNIFGGLRQEYLKSPLIQQRLANSGITMDSATGMPTRPPVIANKARGTMSSANRAAMGGMY